MYQHINILNILNKTSLASENELTFNELVVKNALVKKAIYFLWKGFTLLKAQKTTFHRKVSSKLYCKNKLNFLMNFTFVLLTSRMLNLGKLNMIFKKKIT